MIEDSKIAVQRAAFMVANERKLLDFKYFLSLSFVIIKSMNQTQRRLSLEMGRICMTCMISRVFLNENVIKLLLVTIFLYFSLNSYLL